MIFQKRVKIAVKRHIIVITSDVHIVISIEIFLTYDYHISTSRMQSNFKKRDRGLAAAKDIHDDHICLFQMIKLPSDLIVHLPGARRIPMILTRIEKDVTAVHPRKIVIYFQLPVPAVTHVNGAGQEYLGKASVPCNFLRKFLMGTEHIYSWFFLHASS